MKSQQKDVVLGHLSYMRKSKSDRFFLGVEHKPKKKLNKKIMKPIQEQENYIVIWIESQ